MRYDDRVDRIKNFFRHKLPGGLNFNRRRKRFKIQEVKAKAANAGIILLIILVAFLLVFSFFTSVNNAGVSMEPTIEDGTSVLLDRVRYIVLKPNHNHVVAFKSLSDNQDTIYVKRVVGVPGDSLVIKNGRLYVNGEKYDDVADTNSITYKGVLETEVTLGDDEAKRRGSQKTVLEREKQPTFDIVIEIIDRNTLAVYKNTAEAVDYILRGWPIRPEIRKVDKTYESQQQNPELKSEPEIKDICGYKAYYIDNSTLYLISQGWGSKQTEELLNLAGNRKMNLNTIILYGYSFDFESLKELETNLKQNLNKAVNIEKRY